MIEGNHNSDDDLSAFADYLAEFDSAVSFDNESCQVCGVKVSETLSIQKSPYVLYKSFTEESEIISVTRELDSKCMPYKIEKQLDTSTLNEIRYSYIVLIPFKYLNELQNKKV